MQRGLFVYRPVISIKNTSSDELKLSTSRNSGEAREPESDKGPISTDPFLAVVNGSCAPVSGCDGGGFLFFANEKECSNACIVDNN